METQTLGRIVVGGLLALLGVPAVCEASPEGVARFVAMIASQESGGLCSETSGTSSAMGCYQMTNAALRDIGWKDRDNEWLENEFGIESDGQFLANEEAQYVAMVEFTKLTWRRLPPDAKAAVCGTFDGFQLDHAGLLTGAHILGVVGVTEFIRCQMAPDCLRPAAVRANGGNPLVFRNIVVSRIRAVVRLNLDVSELTGLPAVDCADHALNR